LLKTFFKYLVITASILVIIIVLQRTKLFPSFGDMFSSRPILIDNTPILVKEINNLSQLITITSYNEVVIDSIKKDKPIFTIPILMDDEIVLIGKGKVLAGVDLAKLQTKDIYTNEDSISITLPKSEILQVITNPSDFETFNEKGNWSDNDVTAVKIKLRDKIISAAIQQNILQKSAAIANVMMENFLRSVGFKKVTVQ
jgi:hypothetical protein